MPSHVAEPACLSHGDAASLAIRSINDMFKLRNDDIKSASACHPPSEATSVLTEDAQCRKLFDNLNEVVVRAGQTWRELVATSAASAPSSGQTQASSDELLEVIETVLARMSIWLDAKDKAEAAAFVAVALPLFTVAIESVIAHRDSDVSFHGWSTIFGIVSSSIEKIVRRKLIDKHLVAVRFAPKLMEVILAVRVPRYAERLQPEQVDSIIDTIDSLILATRTLLSKEIKLKTTIASDNRLAQRVCVELDTSVQGALVELLVYLVNPRNHTSATIFESEPIVKHAYYAVVDPDDPVSSIRKFLAILNTAYPKKNRASYTILSATTTNEDGGEISLVTATGMNSKKRRSKSHSTQARPSYLVRIKEATIENHNILVIKTTVQVRTSIATTVHTQPSQPNNDRLFITRLTLAPHILVSGEQASPNTMPNPADWPIERHLTASLAYAPPGRIRMTHSSAPMEDISVHPPSTTSQMNRIQSEEARKGQDTLLINPIEFAMADISVDNGELIQGTDKDKAPIRKSNDTPHKKQKLINNEEDEAQNHRVRENVCPGDGASLVSADSPEKPAKTVRFIGKGKPFFKSSWAHNIGPQIVNNNADDEAREDEENSRTARRSAVSEACDTTLKTSMQRSLDISDPETNLNKEDVFAFPLSKPSTAVGLKRKSAEESDDNAVAPAKVQRNSRTRTSKIKSKDKEGTVSNLVEGHSETANTAKESKQSNARMAKKATTTGRTSRASKKSKTSRASDDDGEEYEQFEEGFMSEIDESSFRHTCVAKRHLSPKRNGRGQTPFEYSESEQEEERIGLGLDIGGHQKLNSKNSMITGKSKANRASHARKNNAKNDECQLGRKDDVARPVTLSHLNSVHGAAFKRDVKGDTCLQVADEHDIIDKVDDDIHSHGTHNYGSDDSLLSSPDLELKSVQNLAAALCRKVAAQRKPRTVQDAVGRLSNATSFESAVSSATSNASNERFHATELHSYFIDTAAGDFSVVGNQDDDGNARVENHMGGSPDIVECEETEAISGEESSRHRDELNKVSDSMYSKLTPLLENGAKAFVQLLLHEHKNKWVAEIGKADRAAQAILSKANSKVIKTVASIEAVLTKPNPFAHVVNLCKEKNNDCRNLMCLPSLEGLRDLPERPDLKWFRPEWSVVEKIGAHQKIENVGTHELDDDTLDDDVGGPDELHLLSDDE